VTSKDHRLDRLSSSLTAKERALLVLRSWKAGEDEDPSWRFSMPDSQAPSFNRYIELMNGVNVHLKPLLVVLNLELEKLGLRVGWLVTFHLWYLSYENLAGEFEYRTGEPPLPTALKPPALPPLLYPAELQERLACELAKVEPNKMDEVVTEHKRVLREGVLEQGAYLRAAQLAVDEVAEAFDGEDPALPVVRELIDRAVEKLEDLREGAESYVGPLEHEEPDEEVVGRMRRLVLGDWA
jgi:hypothetical protein